MRICVFSECYLPVTNGVVTSLVTLREALLARGHTVYVVAPGAAHPDDDTDVFRLPELPFPNHPYHFARPFPRLTVDFDRLAVDVVHCQHPFTIGRMGADLARRCGVPMIYTAHSLYDTMALHARNKLVRTMGKGAARELVRRFCAKAEFVIAPSRHTRDTLRSHGVRARFAVVPSGVRPHTVPAGAREEIRCALSIDKETPLILYVGRLGPEKRLDILLQSVSILRNRIPAAQPPAVLAVVGDGQCRADLESFARSMRIDDRVRFIGVQPHDAIGSWYAAADIFALPSPAETQGIVVIEAMSQRLPCIVVDRGGPREIVEHGVSGLRVPLDAGIFADALQRLISDPLLRERLGGQAARRAERFSPDAMADAMLGVYDAAIQCYAQPVHRGLFKEAARPKRRRARRGI